MIVVFDIDGVLADARHREHHLSGRPKDWDAFFAEVGGDAVIEAGRARLLAEGAGREVVLVSGRPERCRGETLAWLDRHGLAVSRLVLRADADHRPAANVKADLIRDLGTPAVVTLVVDDDAAVVERLTALGYSAVLFEPLR